MDTYVRIYDKFHKSDDDNPTIGLILCSEKSEAVAKYSVLSDSKQLFSSKYLPYLPSEEELRIELLRERHLFQRCGRNPMRMPLIRFKGFSGSGKRVS